MKIAIVGGSNSVLQESYANMISVANPPISVPTNPYTNPHSKRMPLYIDNKAIGATNSLYSLLQIQKYNLLEKNDLLIHEYFVNDNNHYFQDINTPERTQKVLLTIILECMKAQKKLLIVMIYNRADHRAGKYSQSPIFTIYTNLIRQFNIPFIDMYHVLYRKASGNWFHYYKDDTHLNLAGMQLLSEEIVKRLPLIPFLTLCLDHCIDTNLPLETYEQLNVIALYDNAKLLNKTYKTHTLTNSLVNISYLVITDTLQLNFDKLTEILAIEYVCDQNSGYISISDIQKNTLKAEKLVLIQNKPLVSCITFNTHTFTPAINYTISIIQPKDLHPSHYDRERKTYETLKSRPTNFKIASLLVTNGAKLIL